MKNFGKRGMVDPLSVSGSNSTLRVGGARAECVGPGEQQQAEAPRRACAHVRPPLSFLVTQFIRRYVIGEIALGCVEVERRDVIFSHRPREGVEAGKQCLLFQEM